jgi:hypothetical protein
VNGNLRRTVAAVSAAAVLPFAVAGCGLVEQPDPAAWDSEARTTLTDAAGEVATARLVLETAANREVWSSYAVVTLVDAEEAAEKLETDLAKLQPPPERRRQAEDVLDLLAAATTAVREAREAAVDQEYDDADLVAKLTTLKEALERAGESA